MVIPLSASFDSYKIFYYVGRYKNITHAASALFLSQSTVSRSVQSLESELGCRLFERTQYGVRFTPEGQALYEHIAPACESIFRGEERVAQMQLASGGGLRVGVSDFSFSQFVLPVVRAFHEDNPSVRIDIVSSGFYSTHAVFDALLSGRTDLACTAAADIDSFPGGAVEVTPVASYSDMVVAGGCFQELKSGRHTFFDLAAYPFAALYIGPSGEAYMERLLRQSGVDVTPALAADSVNMFLSIIRQCPCVALIPSLFREELAGGPVFEVRMNEPLPTHSINILTVRSAQQTPLRAAFIRELKKHIKSKVQNMPKGIE